MDRRRLARLKSRFAVITGETYLISTGFALGIGWEEVEDAYACIVAWKRG